MGVFGKIISGIQDQYQQNKARKEAERNFVKTNRGTEAICAYITALFDKGQPAYSWLKSNRKPLYPKVMNTNTISLCYTQYGDGRSYESSKSKDIAVATYSFQDMYQWYGLTKGEGYDELTMKIQCETLEFTILDELEKLTHLKRDTVWGALLRCLVDGIRGLK